MAGLLGFGHNFANSLGHTATTRGRKFVSAHRPAVADRVVVKSGAQAAEEALPSWRTSKWYKHGKRSLIASLSLGTFGLLAHRFLPNICFGLSEWFNRSSRLAFRGPFEWAKNIRVPKLGLPEFPKNSGSEMGAWSMAKESVKLVKALMKQKYHERFSGIKYLPDVHRKERNRLWFKPSYVWNRLFNTNKAKLQEVLAIGPIAIKKVQETDYEKLNDKYRAEIAEIEKHLKKKNTPFYLKALLKINIKFRKSAIKENEIFDAMKSNVPAESLDKYKEQIDEITKLAKTKGLHLKNIKPFKAASMGQICTVEDQNGKKYVLKLIRNKIYQGVKQNSNYIDKTKQYNAFQNALPGLQTPENMTSALLDAESFGNLLQEETQMSLEANNTNAMAKRVKGSSVLSQAMEVPEVVAHTDSVALMSFMEGHSLSTPVAQQKFQDKRDDVAKSLIHLLYDTSPDTPSLIPLDGHSGNWLMGDKLKMLDIARIAELRPAAHSQMQKLISSYYLAISNRSLAADEVKTALENPEFMANLIALLETNSNGVENRVYLEKIKKMGADKDAARDVEELVKNLFYAVKPKAPKSNLEKQLDSLDGRKYEAKESSILHVWANVAEQLPNTITEKPISKNDLRAYREKLTHLTSRLFDQKKDVPDAWIESLFSQIVGDAQMKDAQRDTVKRDIKRAVFHDFTTDDNYFY